MYSRKALKLLQCKLFYSGSDFFFLVTYLSKLSVFNRAVSTRTAGSVWWFFTLIMVSSYTANLAAFLTVESKFYAIKSIQDLANNPYGVTYGAKAGGATFSFFKVKEKSSYVRFCPDFDVHIILFIFFRNQITYFIKKCMNIWTAILNYKQKRMMKDWKGRKKVQYSVCWYL